MRLLDLVEKHDLIGPAADRFRERAAFLIADIARRRADQTRDRVLFHIFRHVETADRLIVVEKEIGQRLGQLRLADARRPEEEEGTDRPIRILQSGARATHGPRNGGNRFRLTDNALTERRFHLQELLALTLEHLVDRNAGPARDDLRDMGFRHSLVDQSTGCARALFHFRELLFKLGNDAIGKFRRPLKLARALRLHEFVARTVEFFLELLRTARASTSPPAR